jgi:hypothetical protein
MKKYIYILLFCLSYLEMTSFVQGANIILYTPLGHEVFAITQSEEFSPSEIQAKNQEYINSFPNATFLADATTTYNCHSFAWNMSEGGSTCWLNQSPDLHWYWDDNSYLEKTASAAQKIFYYSGDHSAIVSPTHQGMYESKWGRAPRMRHAPTYGPSSYNMNNRKYYAKIPVAVSGPSMVGGTTSGSYTVNYIPVNTTLSWNYDTNLLTLVSSSATGIVVKPKTSTTVGDASIIAQFTNNSNGNVQSVSFYVGVNGPHLKNVQLVVTKSSDGTQVYPSGGLCPNTYYYAALTSSSTLTNVNWGASSQLTVLSSSNQQLYFRTSSESWGTLSITATTVYGVVKSIMGVTLVGGGSNCGTYYSISSISSTINVQFDMNTFSAGINEKIYTKAPVFDIRVYNITGNLGSCANVRG